MTQCPQCWKFYTPELIAIAGQSLVRLAHTKEEPYQRQQLQHPPYCSDKCYDEAISGERPEYTYDEKGRRFENGIRKLFADPPEED